MGGYSTLGYDTAEITMFAATTLARRRCRQATAAAAAMRQSAEHPPRATPAIPININPIIHQSSSMALC